jgi:hypothetical protein
MSVCACASVRGHSGCVRVRALVRVSCGHARAGRRRRPTAQADGAGRRRRPTAQADGVQKVDVVRDVVRRLEEQEGICGLCVRVLVCSVFPCARIRWFGLVCMRACVCALAGGWAARVFRCACAAVCMRVCTRARGDLRTDTHFIVLALIHRASCTHARVCACVPPRARVRMSARHGRYLGRAPIELNDNAATELGDRCFDQRSHPLELRTRLFLRLCACSSSCE